MIWQEDKLGDHKHRHFDFVAFCGRFPSFTIPSFLNLWSSMVSDCLIMALISVAISLSLTKIYADKHGYEVDANQVR